MENQYIFKHIAYLFAFHKNTLCLHPLSSLCCRKNCLICKRIHNMLIFIICWCCFIIILFYYSWETQYVVNGQWNLYWELGTNKSKNIFEEVWIRNTHSWNSWYRLLIVIIMTIKKQWNPMSGKETRKSLNLQDQITNLTKRQKYS